jgi:hypothetical protein
MASGDPASEAEARFRDRFPRPSFMTLTVALALIITPSVGLLAAELRDPNAESERLAREADLSLRADLLEQGFLRRSCRRALRTCACSPRSASKC